MKRILVVDDDAASRRTLELHLLDQGYQVDTAADAEAAERILAGAEPDAVILDIRMPGRSGLELLADIKRARPDLPAIMITAFHDMETTISAMQAGASEYIHKPIDLDELDQALAKLGRGASATAIADLGGRPQQGMIGQGRIMRDVFKLIGRVSRSQATVLISGESGTGKELVARAIHASGSTPDGPFVVVNCAALVETLLESDMFGHEKGAFTGAVSRQVGKFALARGGTLFLDEVAELSPAVQAKLLRVLQYKEFSPLGGKDLETTDARVVAATNVDLDARVASGRFREDLLYRLKVVTIELPPLRERREDLPDLTRTLLERFAREMGRRVNRIAADVLDAFQAYAWPGNVRELENVLMKAVALAPGDLITLDLLPSELQSVAAAATTDAAAAATSSLAELERRHVAGVLEATGWHKGHACEVLGVSRPRLRRLIETYGLTPPPGLDGED